MNDVDSPPCGWSSSREPGPRPHARRRGHTESLGGIPRRRHLRSVEPGWRSWPARGGYRTRRGGHCASRDPRRTTPLRRGNADCVSNPTVRASASCVGVWPFPRGTHPLGGCESGRTARTRTWRPATWPHDDRSGRQTMADLFRSLDEHPSKVAPPMNHSDLPPRGQRWWLDTGLYRRPSDDSHGLPTTDEALGTPPTQGGRPGGCPVAGEAALRKSGDGLPRARHQGSDHGRRLGGRLGRRDVPRDNSLIRSWQGRSRVAHDARGSSTPAGLLMPWWTWPCSLSSMESYRE
jgi:hypothetical protein